MFPIKMVFFYVYLRAIVNILTSSMLYKWLTVQYARQMRDKFRKLDMWAEYKFWGNRTKQILDEAKQNFYNNMLKESCKKSDDIWPSNNIGSRPNFPSLQPCSRCDPTAGFGNVQLTISLFGTKI